MSEPYTIQAVDGADDDGGTLYVLYDAAGSIITGAAWPYPLEAIARQHGREVVRTSYAADEYGDPDRTLVATRKPTMEEVASMEDDLMDAVTDAIGTTNDEEHVQACKIEGCEEPAVGKASYSGLCEQHKYEEAQRRTQAGWASRKKGEEVEVTTTKPGSEPQLVTLARELVELHEQRTALDERIAQVRENLIAAA